MTTCSIHQPNYLPYLGLFEKVAKSDVFVYYDSAQYTKNDYHNRNTVKGSNGPILLTLPVTVKLGQTILEATFDQRTLGKHLKTLEANYAKAAHFARLKPFLADLFSYEGNNLAEFNMATIGKILALLGSKAKLVRLSQLLPNLDSKSTDALVDICKAVGADRYLSGSGGRGYVETEKFAQAGIALEFQDFKHPTYAQRWGEFVPYMSVLDALLNVGEQETAKLIGMA